MFTNIRIQLNKIHTHKVPFIDDPPDNVAGFLVAEPIPVDCACLRGLVWVQGIQVEWNVERGSSLRV